MIVQGIRKLFFSLQKKFLVEIGAGGVAVVMGVPKAQTCPRRNDNDSDPNTRQGRYHHPQSVPNHKLEVQIVQLRKLRPRHQDNCQIDCKRHSSGERVYDGDHQCEDSERMRRDEPRGDKVEEGEACDDGVEYENDEESAAHDG